MIVIKADTLKQKHQLALIITSTKPTQKKLALVDMYASKRTSHSKVIWILNLLLL